MVIRIATMLPIKMLLDFRLLEDLSIFSIGRDIINQNVGYIL